MRSWTLVFLIGVLLLPWANLGAQPQCPTLDPEICDPHVTYSVHWGCNDGASTCCKTKLIVYGCPPGYDERTALFRWGKHPAVCGAENPVTGEPACIHIQP
mgnify:CR=1 FL=1|jgi:hypothetical protein